MKNIMAKLISHIRVKIFDGRLEKYVNEIIRNSLISMVKKFRDFEIDFNFY